jgi:hypothetical protein
VTGRISALSITCAAGGAFADSVGRNTAITACLARTTDPAAQGCVISAVGACVGSPASQACIDPDVHACLLWAQSNASIDRELRIVVAVYRQSHGSI